MDCKMIQDEYQTRQLQNNIHFEIQRRILYNNQSEIIKPTGRIERKYQINQQHYSARGNYYFCILMNRNTSFQSDLSMPARFNYSQKLYPITNPYKKSYREFDKYSSQVQDRNASQETHYTSINYQTSNEFLGVRKLPDSVSSIRETFSYNPLSTLKKNQYETRQRQGRQKIQKPYDALRQTFDSRSYRKRDENTMIRSVSTNFTPLYHHQGQNISPDNLFQSSINPNRYSTKADAIEIKSFSHLTDDYWMQKPVSIDEQIRRFRQQINRPTTLKRIEKNLDYSIHAKSSTNLHQLPKKYESFAKKNYIEYYTPKIEKSQQTEQFIYDNINVMSPQYARQNKQDGFKASRVSPEKVNHIKAIKENLSASKRNAKTQKVTIDDFIIGKSLGQGRFGTAYMAIDKSTGSLFALKKVKKQVIKQNNLINQFILEVKLQTFFVHPFILKIYGIFDDKEHIYIILQFMQQGTLFNYLKKFKKLSQQDTAQKIRYLAESIKYLQDRGVAHRDIKPENIIMSNDVCKLADFGWATFCDEERRKTYCGTCDYVAPEILQGQEYDESVDLWCVGILTYELSTGKAPFYHMSTKETKKKILNTTFTYPDEFSENLKSFISGLILKDPEQRMSIEQVLAHPLIKNVKLLE